MKNYVKGTMDSIFDFFKKITPSTPIVENKYKILEKITIFKNFPKDELKKLYDLGYEKILNTDQILFKEGDKSDEFYIVIEGSLEVFKYDKKYDFNHSITKVGSGESVGEMSLVDEGLRSASVRSLSKTTLFCIPFAAIHQLAKESPNFFKVYHELSKILSMRLRFSNDIVIQTLEKQLEEYKLRVIMGHFMINVLTVLGLFITLLSSLVYLTKLFSTASYMTILFTLVCSTSVFVLIKKSGLPLSSFGLTTKNWRVAVYESILFTLPFFVLTVILKILEIKFIPAFANQPIIDPFGYLSGRALNRPEMSVTSTWFITLAVYIFIVAPIQEFIARGGLQGPLEEFLVGKHKKWVAIIVSNLLFSVVHVYVDLSIAALVFFPGLLFGWLYSRHKTLIGVSISHAMLGAWGLWIVGLVI